MVVLSTPSVYALSISVVNHGIWFASEMSLYNDNLDKHCNHSHETDSLKADGQVGYVTTHPM